MVFQFCLEIPNLLRFCFFNSKLETTNSKLCLNGVFVQALVTIDLSRFTLFPQGNELYAGLAVRLQPVG